jgi:transcriptional regulator with XRE-family HTH domain
MKAASLPPFRRILGAAIREQRTALELSQSALAARADVKCDYVGKVERGEQNSRINTLIRFFDALTAASGSVPCHPAPPPSDMPPGMVLLQMIATAVGISIAQVANKTYPNAACGKAHGEAHAPANQVERRIMKACLSSSRTAAQLLTSLGYTVRTGNFKRGLQHLIATDLLAMSIPVSDDANMYPGWRFENVATLVPFEGRGGVGRGNARKLRGESK